ncbi:MAG: DMT family transporter [Chloroflexota bacterium]
MIAIKSIPTRRRAVLILTAAAILFSLSGVLIKSVAWDALPLNGGRSIIAAIVLTIYLRRPQFTFSGAQIGGAVAYTFTNLTFVIATQMTTAANAVFLQFSAPIWVILMGYFFLREKPNRYDWGAVIAILIGMGLFFGESLSPSGMRGNIVAIFSGVGLATLVVMLRKQKDGSPAETVILGSLLAFLIGTPFYASQTWSVGNLLPIVLLGVVQLGIAFILYSYAIKHLTAIEAMIIMTLEPILNPILVAIGIGEIPSLLPMIGGLIVVAAVTVRGVLAANQKDEAYD